MGNSAEEGVVVVLAVQSWMLDTADLSAGVAVALDPRTWVDQSRSDGATSRVVRIEAGDETTPRQDVDVRRGRGKARAECREGGCEVCEGKSSLANLKRCPILVCSLLVPTVLLHAMCRHCLRRGSRVGAWAHWRGALLPWSLSPQWSSGALTSSSVQSLQWVV
jgi:hypothetical protein